MNTFEFLIEKTIKLYESNTGWRDSDEWTNQDFAILSEKYRTYRRSFELRNVKKNLGKGEI